MTCHNLYLIKCSVFEYLFNISPYFNIYWAFTVLKSADFTFICDSQQIFLGQVYHSLQIKPFPSVMSTTSTVTSLVARDHNPSNVVDLSHHMCIFILTRGDGTPFNASFIQEEDGIEICIQLGHTHTLKECFDILQLSWSCYFILQMNYKSWCVGSWKHCCCIKKPLELGLLHLLLPMWGPIWQQ